MTLAENLRGGFKALRSLSFPLVHDANQPTRGFLKALFFPPILSLLPTVHAPKHERSFLKCLTNALKGQSK